MLCKKYVEIPSSGKEEKLVDKFMTMNNTK